MFDVSRSMYIFSHKRSPFSTAGRSIVKTVSMCTGELEFDSIFHQEPSGERDDLSDVPFPPVSYLLWTAFIVFIPILLINMLVCVIIMLILLWQQTSASIVCNLTNKSLECIKS